MTTLIIPHFGLKKQYINLKDELLQATDAVLRTGVLVDGTYTHEFESWLANKTRCKYATVTHSGTQALEFIAWHHVHSQPQKIMIPNLSYPATLNAFLSKGWEVELVDINNYGFMTTESQTKTQHDYDSTVWRCHVGLYGASTDEYFYHRTIVDGAQHWLTANGNVGVGMAISFDPTKNLNATGNGGAVVTQDKALFDFVNKVKNNGKPGYDQIGTNSKMSELDCAHLLVRAKYIDEWQSRRRLIRNIYIMEFSEMPFTCLSAPDCPHTNQKFVIYTNRRNELHAYLNEHGVESKIHYPYTLGELPIAAELKKPDMLSVSVMLSRGVLSLPIYPELTDDELYYIIKQVKDFFDK